MLKNEDEKNIVYMKVYLEIYCGDAEHVID